MLISSTLFDLKSRSFSSELSSGTILYGTLFYYNNNRFFSIEDIFYCKGKELERENWGNKFTILESLLNKDLKQMGSNTNIETQVKKLAQTAKLAKIHGIVCSAHEIKKVKQVSKNFEIVVPGIRLTNKVQDQKRVMSPKQALRQGATHLVIGRDLTKGNPKKNIKKVLNALI